MTPVPKWICSVALLVASLLALTLLPRGTSTYHHLVSLGNSLSQVHQVRGVRPLLPAAHQTHIHGRSIRCLQSSKAVHPLSTLEHHTSQQHSIPSAQGLLLGLVPAFLLAFLYVISSRWHKNPSLLQPNYLLSVHGFPAPKLALLAQTGSSQPQTTGRPITQSIKPISPFATPRPSSPKVKPASSSGAASSVRPPVDLAQIANDQDVPIFEVPVERRRPGAQGITRPHLEALSLEDLFPGTGLANAWDSGPKFGQAVRLAMRDDLFIPDPNRSSKANEAMRSTSCTLVVDWRHPGPLHHLTSVFAIHGVHLTGEEFIGKLGSLCGPLVPGRDEGATDWVSVNGADLDGGGAASGSLTDIAPLAARRRVNHSWHCDSGYRARTVLLGFPSEARYQGIGVFSHVVKLSHPLAYRGDIGQVIEWEDRDGELAPEQELEPYVVRPIYKRGCEVLTMLDSDCLHSAPDVQNRLALWRFM